MPQPGARRLARRPRGSTGSSASRRCSFTAPTGVHDWMRRWYSRVRRSCSAKLAAATPRQPMPRSAASSSVPGDVTVTHSGGCGFCTGLGRIARSGIEKHVPCQLKRSSVHIRGSARIVLVPGLLGRVGIDLEAGELAPGRRARGAELEPPAREDVEHRGALGDAHRVVHLRARTPPRRGRRGCACVCIAHAVRNSSGAEQCEYSSRKWCSTAHTVSKPSSSASRTCSSAFSYTVRSTPGRERPRHRQLVEDPEAHGGIVASG